MLLRLSHECLEAVIPALAFVVVFVHQGQKRLEFVFLGFPVRFAEFHCALLLTLLLVSHLERTAALGVAGPGPRQRGVVLLFSEAHFDFARVNKAALEIFDSLLRETI